jgi:hypothetical protein
MPIGVLANSPVMKRIIGNLHGARVLVLRQHACVLKIIIHLARIDRLKDLDHGRDGVSVLFAGVTFIGNVPARTPYVAHGRYQEDSDSDRCL